MVVAGACSASLRAIFLLTMRGIRCCISAGAVAALALLAPLATAQPEESTEDGETGADELPADEPTEATAADVGTESKGSPEAESASSAPPAPSPTPPAVEDYYAEPPPAGGGPDQPQHAGPPPGLIYEPPPPGMGPIYEPPPPPEPDHVAPKNALWVGARGGWWIPFGSAWGRCTLVYDNGACAEGVSFPLRDFVGSGPTVQVDLGARLGRAYNVFVSWEHARLSGGAASLTRKFNDENGVEAAVEQPQSRGGHTNFYAVGARVSSDPDRVGFLAEMLIGFRDLTVEWDPSDVPEEGVRRLTMSEAPLEFRFGLGADIRVHPLLSLSPLFTIGSGRFGKIEQELEDGSKEDAMGPDDLFAAHGWFTLELGAHFDLFGP